MCGTMTTRATELRRTKRGRGVWTSARVANLVLGLWLALSAFLWPHTPTSMGNTWIIGVAIAITAVSALWLPRVRWLNAAFAVWLLISSVAIYPANSETVWNNAIVACLVFVLAVVPTRRHLEISG